MTEQKSSKIEEVNVRLATLDDFEKLNYVYDRDVIKHSQPFAKYPLQDLTLSQNIIFPVAESKNKILAFMIIRLAGSTAKIDKFSILKSYVNKNVIKSMLSFVEPQLVNCELNIYLPKNKKDLLAQFHKLDFRTFNEIPDLFGKESNGLLLKKPVLPKIVKQFSPKKPKENASEIIQPKTEIKTQSPEVQQAIQEANELEEADTDKYYFM